MAIAFTPRHEFRGIGTVRFRAVQLARLTFTRHPIALKIGQVPFGSPKSRTGHFDEARLDRHPTRLPPPRRYAGKHPRGARTPPISRVGAGAGSTGFATAGALNGVEHLRTIGFRKFGGLSPHFAEFRFKIIL
jgi:hypothetical protein